MRLKALLMAFIILGIVIPSSSTVSQPFEDYLKDQERLLNQFVEDDERAFEKYKADVEKKWNEYISSTPEEWVSYADDLEGMSRVNFEDGIIIIEAIVETHSPGDMNEAKAKVAKQIENLLSDDNATGSNLLAGQLRLVDGTPVTPDNVNRYTGEVLPETKETVSHYEGKDGVGRMKVQLEILMAPDHIRQRAREYLPMAQEHSVMYNIDVSLIMAMIETESTFNPMAKSSAPAYGLMQIVPRYAGLEVNRRLFNSDEKPKPSFLYQPDNNIHFGTAYLSSMRARQFRNIMDEQSAMYMMIAAYNTGPSNVARAILGRTGINDAVEAVNKMTPATLYDHLIENLPAQETRDYLVKVTTRMMHYEQW